WVGLVYGHLLLGALTRYLLCVSLCLQRSHHHVRDCSDHLFQVSVELLLSPLKCPQSLFHCIVLLILFGEKNFLTFLRTVRYPGLTGVSPTGSAWSKSLATKSLVRSHIKQALPPWPEPASRSPALTPH
ncbi:UNVERIFIED_CONTAM: hypothetical protein K2H54_002599, partial [Gekko kuhli]